MDNIILGGNKRFSDRASPSALMIHLAFARVVAKLSRPTTQLTTRIHALDSSRYRSKYRLVPSSRLFLLPLANSRINYKRAFSRLFVETSARERSTLRSLRVFTRRAPCSREKFGINGNNFRRTLVIFVAAGMEKGIFKRREGRSSWKLAENEKQTHARRN